MYHTIEFLIHAPLLHLYMCIYVYICYVFRTRHANVQTRLFSIRRINLLKLYTYYFEIYKERRCIEWNTWMKLFSNFMRKNLNEKYYIKYYINFKYFSISETLILDMLIAKLLMVIFLHIVRFILIFWNKQFYFNKRQ